MINKYSAFSYKPGNSIVHKMPAWIKILFLPIFSFIFFYLPPVFSVILLIFQFVICFLLHFSLKEQFTDLKPAVYYTVILYLFSLISGIFGVISGTGTETLVLTERWKTVFFSSFLNKETFFMLVKLFCLLQTASIMYRTSTSLEIREGCEKIEHFMRKLFHLKQENTVSNAISLFISFIPMVFAIWNQSKKAWYARQGKKGIKMYVTLLPVLFSVGIKKAYNTAKAIKIRS